MKFKPYLAILFYSLCFFTGYAQSNTYVIVHGAWGGAWQFKNTDALLTQKGNLVYRPTLTGLGERHHLAHPAIDLKVHIKDVVNTILFENLSDIVLVGHSYGGMVISGVADSIPERIKSMIYLDAMLPIDGESVMQLMGRENTKQLIAGEGQMPDYIVPAWVKDTTITPRDVPHPIKTMTESIRLKNAARLSLSSRYILTFDKGKKLEEDDFFKFYERARQYNWKLNVMEASHNPQIDKLEELIDLLLEQQ